MKTGQYFHDESGTKWFFDSGALCLDYAYTGSFEYERPTWTQVADAAEMQAWIEQRFGKISAPFSAELFTRALQLRHAITTAALDFAGERALDPHAVDIINDWAAIGPIPGHLPGGSLPPIVLTAQMTLSTIANDAIDTLSNASTRLRECAASDCQLLFFDTSRPNSRRWCSMQHCGNRAKARTFRSRNQLDG